MLPRALGFTGAKRVLLAFTKELRSNSGRRLRSIVAAALAAIADMELPKRPGRVEPRAKKRRPKPLPLLTVPRPIARANIRAQQAAKRLIVAP